MPFIGFNIELLQYFDENEYLDALDLELAVMVCRGM